MNKKTSFTLLHAFIAGVLITSFYAGNTEARRLCFAGGDDEGNGGNLCFTVPFSRSLHHETDQADHTPPADANFSCSDDQSCEKAGFAPEGDLCSFDGSACLGGSNDASEDEETATNEPVATETSPEDTPFISDDENYDINPDNEGSSTISTAPLIPQSPEQGNVLESEIENALQKETDLHNARVLQQALRQVICKRDPAHVQKSSVSVRITKKLSTCHLEGILIKIPSFANLHIFVASDSQTAYLAKIAPELKAANPSLIQNDVVPGAIEAFFNPRNMMVIKKFHIRYN